MLRPSKIVSLIQRFIRHSGGAIGLILALTLALLVVAGGAAVDFTRAAQIKSMLQGLVDAAATSGASVYTSASAASTAQTIATNFMNNGIASLPPNGGVTFTVTTGTTSSSGSTTGYTVSISASAKPPTTLLGLFQNSLPISLSATATNPLCHGDLRCGQFCELRLRRQFHLLVHRARWRRRAGGFGGEFALVKYHRQSDDQVTFPVPASQHVWLRL